MARPRGRRRGAAALTSTWKVFFAFIVSFVPLLTKRWGAAAGARSDNPANELRSDVIAPVAATKRCRLDKSKRIKNR